MPFISPGPGDVHVNRPLTNIAIGYMQDTDAFVADKVFPNIAVGKQSDSYFVYERGAWNRDDMKERAPGAESAGSSYDIDQNVYFARVKALHKDIPDQVLDNTDQPINHERDATNFVSRKALIHRELSFAARYLKDGVWTFTIEGVASGNETAADALDPGDNANNKVVKWSDATSTPIEDVSTSATRMQVETGFRPNRFLMTRPVFDRLKNHPDIIARMDRGQTNGPAMATRESLAALFEVDEVMVMEGIFNAAKQGNVEANAFIGGNTALLLYAAPAPGLLVPSAGYTFSWTGRYGNGENGVRIKRFRIERLEVTRVEAQQAFDQRVIGADLGVYFKTII